MAIKLSRQNLDKLGKAVAVPAYNPAKLTAGIVHFGVGNFHRAHQAVYLDDLFNLGRDHDWGLIGAGVMPADELMRVRLGAQDFLTTVVERDNDRSAARVIAPMVGYLDPANGEATIETLADPRIRIVSLTITEGGYFLDPASGVFNANHPAIVADAVNPTRPRTVFGAILAGLRLRRARGVQPFTVLSCDNITSNGEVTRSAVAGIAGLSDPRDADWVVQTVAFPSAMVDRITPAIGARDIGTMSEIYGVDDQCPVFCETFRQWVIEDYFPAGRPALEMVGVRFVADIGSFELMKLRILNAGHAAIAYPAALLDIEFAHEAMEDADIRMFLAKLMTDEVVSTLPPMEDLDPADYVRKVEARFRNAKIADTIARLTQDGSNRQPKFILPTTLDRLRSGRDVVGLSLVSALWCRYLSGPSESGKPLLVMDVAADRLRAAALEAKQDPSAFLILSGVFGEIAKSEKFQERFSQNLNCLWHIGVRETLRRYIAQSR